jgi:hypothetical protein
MLHILFCHITFTIKPAACSVHQTVGTNITCVTPIPVKKKAKLPVSTMHSILWYSFILQMSYPGERSLSVH